MLLNRIGLACSPTSNEPLLFWPRPTTPTATDQTPSCHRPSVPRSCCGSISASKPDQSYDTEAEPNSAVASVHLWLASGSPFGGPAAPPLQPTHPGGDHRR